MIKVKEPKIQMGGENLSKMALTRAIIGRIPGEKQPGGNERISTKTSLGKPKRF